MGIKQSDLEWDDRVESDAAMMADPKAALEYVLAEWRRGNPHTDESPALSREMQAEAVVMEDLIGSHYAIFKNAVRKDIQVYWLVIHKAGQWLRVRIEIEPAPVIMRDRFDEHEWGDGDAIVIAFVDLEKDTVTYEPPLDEVAEAI